MALAVRPNLSRDSRTSRTFSKPATTTTLRAIWTRPSAVTEHVCLQLETWGAWQTDGAADSRGAGLGAEVFGLRRPSSTISSEISRYRRGDYDQALDWYRKSLEIYEALGNRAGMATSYHQLGMVAQDAATTTRRWTGTASPWRSAKRSATAPAWPAPIISWAIVAYARGDYDQALDWYRKSLEIFEALGDRAGMANSYHQLGIVAHKRGDYDQALDWYRKSLEINEALGDRAGMASSYHQLGRVAQDRGDYDQALDWYRKSLEISEALGDRAGMARSISQIGVLYTERGEAEEAVPFNLRSLALRLEIGSPEARTDLHWLTRQREALGAERFEQILREHLDEESAAAVLKMLDDFAAGQAKPD